VCSAEGKLSSVASSGAKVRRINQTRAARKKSPDPTHLHYVDGSDATAADIRRDVPAKPGASTDTDDLAFVSLAGRQFRAENVPVVACRRRGSMVHSGRDLARRWGSRCGPFTVSFAENED
jgi:hypothetical protein